MNATQRTGSNSNMVSKRNARLGAERQNLEILKALAANKVRQDIGVGDRAAASVARPAVDLIEIEEKIAPGKVERITEPGQKTARRKMPAVIARMDPMDPRRRAADAYAVALEKIGSTAGASTDNDVVDGGAGSSDGGASTRYKLATTLRIVEACANDWKVSPETGRYVRGLDLIVLAPSKRHGDRMAITAMGLLEAVCVDGLSMKQILLNHGWGGHCRDAGKLTATVEDLLDLVADGLGLSGRR